MKLNQFIERLAKKAAVDTTLLALPASVNDVDVPDDIANNIDKALMTLEAAKNNGEVRKAARAEALNGVDSKVAELLEELGIEDADDITTEKNSYEKIGKLTKKVKELESKKAGASTKTDKAEIEKQITELNGKLKVANDTLVAKEKEFAAKRNEDLTSFDVQKKLLVKDYALPKEMNADLKVKTANSAIDMALQAKGFKIVRNEQGNLQIVDKDGNKAFSDNHEELQIDTFIDGALAQNKLLRIHDQSPAGSGNNGQPANIPGNQTQGGNAQVASQIDSQMKELGFAV